MSDTSTPGEPRRSDHAFARVRERAYDAAADDSLPVAERQRRILALGREFLGVENGHVERVEGDTHRVTVSVNDEAPVVPAGATFDGAATFCRQTVERDAALAVSDAAADGWADDPAHEVHGLACYLGSRITVDGETYGTVCFVDETPRAREFEPTERAFVELVARLFGRLLSDRRAPAPTDEAAKYESLVAAAPDAVVVAEASERRVVEANEAAADLLGRERGALLGRRVETFAPEGRRDEYVAAFEALVAGEDGPRESLPDGSRLVLRRADGTRVPVAVSADVVELGGDPHVHAVVRDVGDRDRRERLLDLVNRVLRHNLRNEMNVVPAGGRALAADLDAPESARALVPPQFDAALRALVDNALDHAGDDPDVTVRVTRGDDAVTVAVADDGPGIPAHERRVLEGGEETPLDHGSGVGTWLVNWVVGAADGRVETSVDEEGSTVRVWLPAA